MSKDVLTIVEQGPVYKPTTSLARQIRLDKHDQMTSVLNPEYQESTENAPEPGHRKAEESEGILKIQDAGTYCGPKLTMATSVRLDLSDLYDTPASGSAHTRDDRTTFNFSPMNSNASTEGSSMMKNNSQTSWLMGGDKVSSGSTCHVPEWNATDTYVTAEMLKIGDKLKVGARTDHGYILLAQKQEEEESDAQEESPAARFRIGSILVAIKEETEGASIADETKPADVKVLDKQSTILRIGRRRFLTLLDKHSLDVVLVEEKEPVMSEEHDAVYPDTRPTPGAN